jgi:hypothetical protein
MFTAIISAQVLRDTSALLQAMHNATAINHFPIRAFAIPL